MKQLKVYGLTCVLMMVAMVAGATTIIMPTDEQLIAKAPLILEGTVVSTAPVVEDGGTIWTDTVIDVARVVKGHAPDRITVHELGGETEDRITKIYGAPKFLSGEHVLLFLEKNPRGGYRTMDLFVGKMKEAKASNGRRLWLRDDAGAEAALYDQNLQPLQGRKNVQRDAAKFEKFLAERVAGRKGIKDYGVESPVLDDVNQTEVKSEPNVSAQFTLLSDPSVYRWQKFDGGQTAQWYSNGSQSGYTNGGVSELQTAMSSWSGYSSANINYSYAGSKSGTPGGLSNSNGVNEVVFNDPQGEISGTFTGSGVVGQGGFNAVSGSSNWTAPFTADADHTAGTKKQWHIAEGNLVIQDGVTPAKGISSSRLAEIIAHEFGHTLGFGHSSDSSALMYYSVTGKGPSLRADDQLAARWLYPNGSSNPPAETIPNAPSSVNATVNGNDATVTWADNSSNESGFRVYLAQGSGSFSKVADLGANVKSALLSNLASGSWKVYVTAWNSAGTSSNSNTDSFTVASSPVAAFTISPASGTAGITSFTFFDESTGTVTSRTWNFGDGASSSAMTASHVYANAGTYTVTLTVSGNGTTSQKSKSVSVSSAATKPVAAFHFNPSSGIEDQTTFTFFDDSTGTVSSRTWNFGDGSSSNSSVPSHVYTKAGTYTVTLTVSGSAGSSQTSKSLSVTSPAPVSQPVTASFSFSPSTATAGSGVQFNDQSSGSPSSWSWSFGDGTSSTSRNPTHTYAGPGNYTVRLTASNATSSSSATRTITVVTPSTETYRTLVSAAAQTSGAGGTSWRTELTLFNAGSRSSVITILFLPNGGGNVLSRTISLSALQSATYSNALVELWGINNIAGALAIEATSSGAIADLRVTSRTFTNGVKGTYGQAVPNVAPEQLEKTLYVTAIQASSAYRTNIGLVNRDGVPVSATLTLFSPTGSTLATENVTVAANSFQQAALGSYFPEVAGGISGAVTMRVTATSADALSAYASVIDNVTQDPIYIQAVPASDGSSMTIPVVSRTNGTNGTNWRSDVTLFNPTSTSKSLTLKFGSSTKTVSLGGFDTKVLGDVVAQFGLSAGSGALQISWGSGTGPVVTSRTYTTAGAGTYGQSIDPVNDFSSSQFVPGLRHDGSYRSNVGFVNGGFSTETFTVRALATWGGELARTTITLAPGQWTQASAAALFPNANLGSFTLVIDGDSNAQLFAYGSMVDNATGDPVFYAGQ